MTFADAAGIMIGDSGGRSAEPTLPDSITYKDVDDYSGKITEQYSDGNKREILVSISNKGTINETITSLRFLLADGTVEKQINFSGFYVG